MTAVGYAFIYGVSSVLLSSTFLSRPISFYAGLIACSSIIAMNYQSLYGYCLIASAMLGLTVRDAQQSFYNKDLSNVSDDTRMFSILTMLSVLLIPVFTNGVNTAITMGSKGNSEVIMLAQVVLASMLISLIRLDKNYEASSKSTKANIPFSAKIICWYSMLYNATSFPVRMIVSPLIIYGAIKAMGIDDYAIGLTGSVIGLITILATLIRLLLPNSQIDSVLVMTRYHRIGILTMMAIVAISIGLSQDFWSPKAMPWVITTGACLHLSLEVTAKLWSLGFITTLRELTFKEGNSSVYQAAYLHFMSMKNFGSSLGFLLFASFLWLFNYPLNAFITGGVAIIFVMMTSRQIRSEISPL